MQRKCRHYPLREHGPRHHVQRCVSIVRSEPSVHRHLLSARHRTIHSAVHIWTLSATDRRTAVVVDRNSSCGRVPWSLASRAAARHPPLPVTKLQFAAMDTFGSREQTSLLRVQRQSQQVRPRRSRTVIWPIRFQHRRRLPMSTSTRYSYLPVVDDREIRRCRRPYSTCRCLVVSSASRRSRRRRRGRCRRRRAPAASTVRNCSSCPRTAPACVRMLRMTVWLALNMRRVCVPPGRCSITVRPMTMEVTGRSVVLGNRRRRVLALRQSVGGVASGYCLHCCRWFCHASGATPR